MVLTVSCVLSPNTEDDLVLLDFPKASKGMELAGFIGAMYSTPFSGMIDDLSGLDLSDGETFTSTVQEQLNLLGVAEQNLPLIPGFSYGNVNSLKTGEELYIYGYKAEVTKKQKTKDGIFIRYTIETEEDGPFGMIDYYYSKDTKRFSYREFLSVGIGIDQFYFFEMKDIPITKGNAGLGFTTVENGEPLPFKFACLQLNNDSTIGSVVNYSFAEYDMVMTFNKKFSASCAYTIHGNNFYNLDPENIFLKDESKHHACHSLKDDLLDFFDPLDGTKDGAAKTSNKTTCFDGTSRYNMGLNVESAIAFYNLAYGKDFSFDGYNENSTIKDFDEVSGELQLSESLLLTTATKDYNHNIYGFAYPVVFSLLDKKGAAVSSEMSMDGMISEIIYTTVPTGFDGEYVTYLARFTDFSSYGYTSNLTYEEFVTTHLINCGMPASLAASVYAKMKSDYNEMTRKN